VTWLDQQKVLRDVLLSPAPSDGALQRLGGQARRWLVYRRMVRARFADVLGEALERFRTVIGVEPFAALVERFLAASPPASPYLRDVPGEFLRFLEGLRGPEAEALPPFTLDLARFECAELELAHVPDERVEVAPLDMHLHAVLSPAARLLELDHDLSSVVAAPAPPVDVAEGAAPPPRRDWAICVYRDAKTNDVEFLELTAMAARIVRGIHRDEAPLVDIAKSAAAEAGAPIDSSFAGALGTLLADLVERGVIVGSRARATG
jgi:hypothetical protein